MLSCGTHERTEARIFFGAEDKRSHFDGFRASSKNEQEGFHGAVIIARCALGQVLLGLACGNAKYTTLELTPHHFLHTRVP